MAVEDRWKGQIEEATRDSVVALRLGTRREEDSNFFESVRKEFSTIPLAERMTGLSENVVSEMGKIIGNKLEMADATNLVLDAIAENTNNNKALFEFLTEKGEVDAKTVAQVVFGIRDLHRLNVPNADVWGDLPEEIQEKLKEHYGLVDRFRQKMFGNENIERLLQGIFESNTAIAVSIQTQMKEAREAQTSYQSDKDGLSFTDPKIESVMFFIALERAYGEVGGINPQLVPDFAERVKLVEQMAIWFMTGPFTRKYLQNLMAEAGGNFELATPVEQMIGALFSTRQIFEEFRLTYRGDKDEMEAFTKKLWGPEQWDAIVNNANVDIRYLMEDGREVVINASVEEEYGLLTGDYGEPLALADLDFKEARKVLKHYEGLIKAKYGDEIDPVRVLGKYLRMKDYRRDLKSKREDLRHLIANERNHGDRIHRGERLTDQEQLFVDQILCQDVFRSEKQNYRLSHEGQNQTQLEAGGIIIPWFLEGDEVEKFNDDTSAMYVFSEHDNPLRDGRIIPGQEWATLDRTDFDDHASKLYIDYLFKKYKIDPSKVVAVDLPRFESGLPHRMLLKVGKGRYGSTSAVDKKGWLELGLLSNQRPAERGRGSFNTLYEVVMKPDGLPLLDDNGEPILMAKKDADGNPMYQLDDQGRPIRRKDAQNRWIEDPMGMHNQEFRFLKTDHLVTRDNGDETASIAVNQLQYRMQGGALELDGNGNPIFDRDYGFVADQLVYRRNPGGDLMLDDRGRPIVAGVDPQAGIPVFLVSRTVIRRGDPVIIDRSGREVVIQNGEVFVIDKRNRGHLIATEEYRGLPQWQKDDHDRVVFDEYGEPQAVTEYLYEPKKGEDGEPMYEPMVDEGGEIQYGTPVDIIAKNVLAARLSPFHQAVRVMKMMDCTLPHLDPGNRGTILEKGLLKGIHHFAYLEYYKVLWPAMYDLTRPSMSDLLFRKRKNLLAYQALNEHPNRTIRFRNPQRAGQEITLLPYEFPKESEADKTIRDKLNRGEELSSQESQREEEMYRTGQWVPKIDPEGKVYSASEFAKVYVPDQLWTHRAQIQLINLEYKRLAEMAELSEAFWNDELTLVKRGARDTEVGNATVLSLAENEGRRDWFKQGRGDVIPTEAELRNIADASDVRELFSKAQRKELLRLRNEDRQNNTNTADEYERQVAGDIRVREVQRLKTERDALVQKIKAGESADMVRDLIIEEEFGARINWLKKDDQDKYVLQDDWVIGELGGNTDEAVALMNKAIKKLHAAYAYVIDRSENRLLAVGNAHRSTRISRDKLVQDEGRLLSFAEQMAQLAGSESVYARGIRTLKAHNTLMSLGMDVKNMAPITKEGRVGFANVLRKSKGLKGQYLGNERDLMTAHWDYVSRGAILQSLKVALVTQSSQALDPAILRRLGLSVDRVRDFQDLTYQLMQQIRTSGNLTSEIAEKYYGQVSETLGQMASTMGWKDAEGGMMETLGFVSFLIDMLVPQKMGTIFKEVDRGGKEIPLATMHKMQPIASKGGFRKEIDVNVAADGSVVGPGLILDRVGKQTGTHVIVYPAAGKPYLTGPTYTLARQVWHKGVNLAKGRVDFYDTNKDEYWIYDKYFPFPQLRTDDKDYDELTEDLVRYFGGVLIDKVGFDEPYRIELYEMYGMKP